MALRKVRGLFARSCSESHQETGRFARSALKPSEDAHLAKIHSMDDQVSKLIETFTVDMQIGTAQKVAAMENLLSSLAEPITRLLHGSHTSVQAVNEDERLRVLRWLSVVPFSKHHQRHIESMNTGSGSWLLRHDRYLTWMNASSSSIFLLHGIAGSGKTSLSSTVIDSFLQARSREPLTAPVAYFYCSKNPAEADRSDPDEIFRCILRQLTVATAPVATAHVAILQEFERRKIAAEADGFEIAKLNSEECIKMILDTTALNPANIIVDALDEVCPASRHDLLLALQQIAESSLNVVKIFVTSRDDGSIQRLLSGATDFKIHKDLVQDDLCEFVHRQLSLAIKSRRILHGDVSQYLERDLRAALILGAGEM